MKKKHSVAKFLRQTLKQSVKNVATVEEQKKIKNSAAVDCREKLSETHKRHVNLLGVFLHSVLLYFQTAASWWSLTS